MKSLFINANIVNVFTDEIFKSNLLIDDDKICGFGDYYNVDDADKVIDTNNKYICPCLIDAHMHVESTKITPPNLSDELAVHGTCAIVADPHEIANVCGIDGIKYIVEASKNLDVDIYYMVPSCVPASPFDESASALDASTIKEIYKFPKILGLAEMMNYPGVINNNEDVITKLDYAYKHNKIINGHAPLLSGRDLDKYISFSIYDDHESASFEEAQEKISKGQFAFIREGSSAKNLKDLLKLFNNKFNRRCLLCTDDISANDIFLKGHIDNIIRQSVSYGIDPVVAIRMASIQTAQFYNLKGIGAIAPGYKASFIVLSDLNNFSIDQVYIKGKLIRRSNKCKTNHVIPNYKILNSIICKKLTKNHFLLNISGFHRTKVIQCFPHSLITNLCVETLNYDYDNGVNIKKDIIKIAVVERHGKSGNISVGFINGLKINNGAIASSIAHDSHNIVIAGSNPEDMSLAQNAIVDMNGGYVVVNNKKVIASLKLNVAGLMSDCTAKNLTDNLDTVLKSLDIIAPHACYNLFDTLQFMSLTVIPNIKLSAKGLVDVNKFSLTNLVDP